MYVLYNKSEHICFLFYIFCGSPLARPCFHKRSLITCIHCVQTELFYLKSSPNPKLFRFVNATDDPMIAPDVIDVPIRIARTKDKVVHVQTQVYIM